MLGPIEQMVPIGDLERRFQDIAAALGRAAAAVPEPVVAATEVCAFQRLVRLVGDHTGLRDHPGLRQKLAGFIGGNDEETAGTWIRRLQGGRTARDDWQHLLDVLTVPETFFYRDQPQLDVLREELLPQLIEAKRRDARPTLRIWSAACSTGEEPYTLAMMAVDALAAAGLAYESPAGLILTPPWTVTVLGTDIAVRSLEHARRGVYREFGLGSFRDMPPRYRRFFAAAAVPGALGQSWAVRGDIRPLVFLQQHNLLDSEPPATDFDLILCRNVMIYFDEFGKRSACRLLDRALRPGGMIALGPTDDPLYLEGYQPLSVRTSPLLRKFPGRSWP